MLCYAMLCYAMLCYAMLCYAILYYTTAVGKSNSGKKTHAGGLGVRTSPFASSWYVQLEPLMQHNELLEWWTDSKIDDCTLVRSLEQKPS